jgi:hypothetical protein
VSAARLATRLVIAAPLVIAAGVARAQTMADQEERLIDIHSLLLDLPPLQAPGVLAPGRAVVGLELVTIPPIDGTTGSREQITASDRTPVYPRPRLAIGLPAPEGFRAFAGLSYIPPFRINDVSTHYGALEAGLAWVPGAFRVGLRGHGLYAESRSPVTDPSTRDTLYTGGWGADASTSWRLALRHRLELEPYAGAGIVGLSSDFHVTSDRNVLHGDYTGPALHAGLRLGWKDRWEALTELDSYPNRLVHVNFRVGWLFR